MKSNYNLWCETYFHVLKKYYDKFVLLFYNNPPSFKDFCEYCYQNTTKTVKNGILTAYISPFA